MKKVCKKCRIFVETATCPICGGNQFTESWKGKVVILDVEKSAIAKKMKITKAGTYAIKAG